eukprot:CAMPEP_0115114472 /NCGR_PEP_ID=MMETSP0227-20121206/42088_1 /TAXON_ID=89957 /ORGANISM="Polarella glacialis, Strain CCMP 1383" /LENGTH=59 /DNA_ID=CAMNT_0002514901 /DNA_START=1 /DNA_END=180 /DNA_ORIENTATION=+
MAPSAIPSGTHEDHHISALAGADNAAAERKSDDPATDCKEVDEGTAARCTGVVEDPAAN